MAVSPAAMRTTDGLDGLAPPPQLRLMRPSRDSISRSKVPTSTPIPLISPSEMPNREPSMAAPSLLLKALMSRGA